MIHKEPKAKPVLFQAPNLPIKVALVASVAGLLVLPVPVLNTIVATFALGAWFTWAWLELFDGLNVYRRILGGSVMALVLIVVIIAQKIIVGL